MAELISESLSKDPHYGPGMRLRRAREAKGWTVEQVAKRLHLSESAVAALEADDYGHFAAEVYVRGYLTNYARLLAVSVDEILDAQKRVQGFPATRDTNPRQRPANPVNATPRRGGRGDPVAHKEPERHSRWSGWWLALLSSVLIFGWLWRESGRPLPWLPDGALPAASSTASEGGGLAGLDSGTDRASDVSSETGVTPVGDDPNAAAGTADVAATMAGTGATPAAAETAPATAGQQTEDHGFALDSIVIRFKQDSWATVFDAEGKRLFFRTGAAGTTETLKGHAPFKVTVGRIANVSIEFNGESFSPPDPNARATARFTVPPVVGQ
jgi:cytoskeleton protein RodZ